VKFELGKIHNVDARVLLGAMESGSVDLCLTDPPYEVEYAEWDKWVHGWLDEARRVSTTVAFTPGIVNVYRYPQPDWIVAWGKPGSTRRNMSGGFNHWEPVLVYGKRKIQVDFVNVPVISNINELSVLHPCPKPLKLYKWLIDKLSDGGLICDPFIGSGTTAIAAEQLKREWVGSEIDPQHWQESTERIERWRAQGVLDFDGQRSDKANCI
jgi:DNA modification methylase